MFYVFPRAINFARWRRTSVLRRMRVMVHDRERRKTAKWSAGRQTCGDLYALQWAYVINKVLPRSKMGQLQKNRSSVSQKWVEINSSGLMIDRKTIQRHPYIPH